MGLTDGTVQRLTGCTLRCIDKPWAFSQGNRAAIDRHWARRQAENPSFFNGTVLILTESRITDSVLEGTFARSDFASNIYWREAGYPDTTVWDAFGSAIIRSAEGHILLSVQGAGSLSVGETRFPSGFIDHNDVGRDGTVDLAASVHREVAEETGLGPDVVTAAPGFILSVTGQLASLGVEFHSRLPATDLRNRVMAHIRSSAEPELSEVLIARSRRDIDEARTPAFTRQVLRLLLPE